MKKRLSPALVALAILVGIGGLAGTAAAQTAEIAEIAPQIATVQGSSVHAFADLDVIAGATANLVRYESGVAVELRTGGLAAASPYTIWWVVFNTPEGCSEDCGEDDIFNADGELDPNPAANLSILWAAGALSDAAGNAAFSALLPVGNPPGEVLVGPGLTDAGHAEIHVVVRDHGALDPARAYEQFNTFEGTCATCFDIQFAVFAPLATLAGR